VAITGCERPSNDSDIISSEDSVYVFVDDVMKYYYLWNDKVPDVDIFKYNSPSDLLDDLKYNALDKWSFIDKANVIGPLFQEGKYFGFGFYMKWDENYELSVVVVYENSDAYTAGLRRGNRISQINGIDVTHINDFTPFFDDQPLTWIFKVYDNNDQLHEITLSKSTITQNSVLYQNVYNVSGHQTGYLVFDSFLGYSKVEMEDAFTYFKNNNISELIIDLRYNLGGYSSIAEEMADMIIPSSDVGKEFYSLEHNKNIASDFDTTIRFHSNSLNLNLNRVFFITTDMSASASELLISVCL
jgi:C-terminal processing protease CtpA/Prc